MTSTFTSHRFSAARHALAGTALALAVAGAAPSASQAAFPGGNGLIAAAFEWCPSDFDDDERLVATMRPDGSERRVLNETCDFRPDTSVASPFWFADGARMLVVRRTPGGGPADGWHTMSADGSESTPVPIAPRPGFSDPTDMSPSPRGGFVVHVRNASGQQRQSIWRARSDGSGEQWLRRGSLPRWSPNGRTIAFVAPDARRADGSVRPGATWLMRATTGAALRKVAPTAQSLDWSPDARRLAYIPGRAGHPLWGGAGVYVVGSDGRGLRRVTPRGWRASSAVFSPDGRRIAFVRLREYPNEEHVEYSIWTIDVGGTRARRLFTSESYGPDDFADPPTLSWQPVSR